MSAHETCLCKRTSDDVTPEEGPNSLKKAKTEGARYRVNCLPGPQEPFKRDSVDLAVGAIEGTGGVLVRRRLTLSSAPFSTP